MGLNKRTSFSRFMAAMAAATFCFAILFAEDEQTADVDPAVKEARDRIRKEFKETYDIAGAAERLADGNTIRYDQKESRDLVNEKIEQGMSPTEAMAESRKEGQSFIALAGSSNVTYATAGNCFDFVHFAAWFAGKAQGPLYRYDNGLNVIDPGTLTKWDYKSEIPRGKVIIGTMPGFMGGQGSDGTYHFGVSLGNGMVASNRDQGAKIENLKDVFGGWGYYLFGNVYYGDYASYKGQTATSQSGGKCVSPGPLGTAEMATAFGLPSEPAEPISEADSQRVKLAQYVLDAMDAIAACNEERFRIALAKIAEIRWNAEIVRKKLVELEVDLGLQKAKLQEQLQMGVSPAQQTQIQEMISSIEQKIRDLDLPIKDWQRLVEEAKAQEIRLSASFKENCEKKQASPSSTANAVGSPEGKNQQTIIVILQTGPVVVCFPCQEIANQLASTEFLLKTAQSDLEATEKDIQRYQNKKADLEKRLKELQDRLNHQIGKGASGTDPQTGKHIDSQYGNNGDINVKTTNPDGTTTTSSYQSKYMQRLKEQIKETEQSIADTDAEIKKLQTWKERTEGLVQDLTKKVAELRKQLEDCIKKYCKGTLQTAAMISTGTDGAVSIQVFYDRADCHFGGGTTIITVPPGGGPVIVQNPGQDGTPNAPPASPETTSPPSGQPDSGQPSEPHSGGSPEDSPKNSTTSSPGKSGIPVTTIPRESKKDNQPGQQPPPDQPQQPQATVVLIVKASEQVIQKGQTVTQVVSSAQLKIPGLEPPLPVGDQQIDDAGYDEEPKYAEKIADGRLQVKLLAGRKLSDFIKKDIDLDLSPQESTMLGFPYDEANPKTADPKSHLPEGLHSYVKHSYPIAKTLVVVIQYPLSRKDQITDMLSTITKAQYAELNPCRTVLKTDDPYFSSKSSWNQNYDDQWAIKHVGFTLDAKFPWNAPEKLKPVIVAVVDTGLDWNHQDVSRENLWSNPREVSGNGVDDDHNGYIDDVIGFDFFRRNNMPWDHNGHGTFVTGVIAATQNNKVGIAGVNPKAKIMALKALNGFGHTRASYLAEAITYAANNGARVINVSVGGSMLTRTEQMAIDYAHSKGALLVVAAGNEAQDVGNVSPAGLKNVITVASSDANDKRAAYSNWGAGVDITAPGDDVLSLRARRTDLMRDVAEVKYAPGAAYVGSDKRYYRASGTSFSTPIVSGTASLIFSMKPELTNIDVERMILNSAKDVELPGVDQHSGYGLLDASAAVSADPRFYIASEISGVKVVTQGGTAVQVTGTADADSFGSAFLELGAGEQPSQWKKVGQPLAVSMKQGVLGLIPAGELAGSAKWIIRLVTQHQNGRTREARFRLDLQ